MKIKISKRLWFYFISSVFIILIATAMVTFSLAFLMINSGNFQPDRAQPMFPIIMLLLVSVIVGTFLSLLVAHRILYPISKFSKASTEVANGNFTIKLEETSKIPEIKDFIRNFNLMTQELSSIETLRNDFIVNVSHEFKTPLSAIEGYAALIQSEDLTEQEKQDYTNMIREATTQLSTLTGNILELSKLENDDIILEKDYIQLDEQIRQAILWLQPKWDEKDIAWEIRLSSTSYWGNKRLAMQIWLNLIGNAIKFTPAGGTISISLQNNNDNLIVTIADTGIGMSEMTQKNIFDKFYQSDQARNISGNGLGLSLVHRIVTIFGGKIDVDSTEDIGSVFTVTLPNDNK